MWSSCCWSSSRNALGPAPRAAEACAQAGDHRRACWPNFTLTDAHDLVRMAAA